MNATAHTPHHPLRLAIVGGDPTSWIGGVHHCAAHFDGFWQVVAGVFSSNANRSRDAAAGLGLDPARGNAEVTSMLAAEKAHYTYSVAALDAGLDEIGDKPVGTTSSVVAQVQPAGT